MKLQVLPALAAALILAACGQPEEADTNAQSSSSSATVAASPAAPAQANVTTFDLSAVPVSNAALGEFPYVNVPAGYEVYEGRTLDLAAFPIWTGANFQLVEGRVYMAQSSVPEGKTYSRLEFERGVQQAATALGAVRVSRGEVPNEMFEALPRDVVQDASRGLGDRFGSPFTTYVIRRADRTVWIQVVAGQNSASWAVVDTPSAQQ